MPYDPLDQDTIAAIATPSGRGGIGIIRLSGSRSKEIVEKIFKFKDSAHQMESHRLYLGKLIDPPSGEMIDEILLSIMQAPHSYTREDVVEINSHSGPVLLSRILEIILEQGVRLAKPGEFTFRAFVNGRIDLTQAEAIVDLINSKSDTGLKLASRQLDGDLRMVIERFRERVVEILAHIEVSIDFTDDELPAMPLEKTAVVMDEDIIKPIEKILSSYSFKEKWMGGVNTVIAGRVNVGKSSLFNRLLNKQRAIVTAIPGTTRDIIESILYIEGLPFLLMDTAGIRKVKGKVEKIGVNLTEKELEKADLSLILIDRSRPLHRDDLKVLARAKKGKSLIVINKIDLPPKINEDELDRITKDHPKIRISALTGNGIGDLRKIMRETVAKNDPDIASLSLAPNIRQKIALTEASQHFENAVTSMKNGSPMEIIAMDLNSGLKALAEITGDTGDNALYEKIFSEFCIGK